MAFQIRSQLRSCLQQLRGLRWTRNRPLPGSETRKIVMGISWYYIYIHMLILCIYIYINIYMYMYMYINYKYKYDYRYRSIDIKKCINYIYIIHICVSNQHCDIWVCLNMGYTALIHDRFNRKNDDKPEKTGTLFSDKTLMCCGIA